MVTPRVVHRPLASTLAFVLVLASCGESSPTGTAPRHADPTVPPGPADFGPIGARMVFVGCCEAGPPAIYLVEEEGGRPVRLIDPGEYEGEYDPAWSPDGTRIAFTRDDPYEWSPSWEAVADIWSVASVGGSPRNLTRKNSDDASPAWSPDGQSIAFTTNRDGDYEIYVMAADGSGQTNLSNNPGAVDLLPAWSPDGTKIAFSSGRGGTSDIYVMNADGSNVVRLTDDPALDEGAAWSPDGSRIAFTRRDPGASVDVWVMDADGGNPLPLTDDPADDFAPSWAPDGASILFTSSRDGSHDIHEMAPDGSNPVNLSRSPGFGESRAVWAPSPGGG